MSSKYEKKNFNSSKMSYRKIFQEFCQVCMLLLLPGQGIEGRERKKISNFLHLSFTIKEKESPPYAHSFMNKFTVLFYFSTLKFTPKLNMAFQSLQICI